MNRQEELLKEIFPRDWKNPKPAELYDLVVIGAGPGGMTAASLAAGYHKRVALVEKEHMGGECLSYGCIPSKAMLRSSRAADEMRNGKEFGIECSGKVSVDFSAVMDRVRRLRNAVSKHDSPSLFQQMGIDLFLGDGHFTAPDRLEVSGYSLHFKKAILATGTLPLQLNVPGLKEAGYLTNQTVFELTHLPKRLAVFGAGAMGCELAQAFSRFGSQVMMITHGSRILSHEDATAAERLAKQFEKEGIQILTNSKIARIETKGKEKIIHIEGRSPIHADEILVALGRLPQVQGFGLEKANVSADPKNGIAVNDFLQTSNPNIYSIGDMSYKFTHVSTEHAHLAVQNIFGSGNGRKSTLAVPWCTFTDPEIAHVGMDENEAAAKGIPVSKIQFEMADVPRAILDGDTVGFCKLFVREGTDQILGATLMSKHAGEMISELSVAIANQIGLTGLTRAIHCFPTQAEVFRMAAAALLKKRTLNHKKSA